MSTFGSTILEEMVYLSTLNKYIYQPHETGDIVILQEDPTKWPLAKVTKVYPGKDSLVRAVDVLTSKGTYRRPVHKLAVLLPAEI